jgi:hypothetical protein
MLFLTAEMVAPQMTAAQQTRFDTTRRALAEEGLPLGSRSGRQPRRIGRIHRMGAWPGYRRIGLRPRLVRPNVVEGARARL